MRAAFYFFILQLGHRKPFFSCAVDRVLFVVDVVEDQPRGVHSAGFFSLWLNSFEGLFVRSFVSVWGRALFVCARPLYVGQSSDLPL